MGLEQPAKHILCLQYDLEVCSFGHIATNSLRAGSLPHIIRGGNEAVGMLGKYLQMPRCAPRTVFVRAQVHGGNKRGSSRKRRLVLSSSIFELTMSAAKLLYHRAKKTPSKSVR